LSIEKSMQEKQQLLSLLGLCRKAGLVSFGHDAAKKAVRGRKARLCLLCENASDRLKEEFRRLAAEEKIPLLEPALSSDDLKQATQYSAAVCTIDNPGFAKKIQALIQQ